MGTAPAGGRGFGAYDLAPMGATVTGEWVVARNVLSRVGGASIHDDDAARRLGFPGGLVPSNVQVVLVVRELVRLHGPRWYERGVLEHNWTAPVYAGEEVRVVIDGDDFRLEKGDGTVCAAGVAALAGGDDGDDGDDLAAPWERPGAPAALDVGDYDPLPGEQPGHRYPDSEVSITAGAVERGLGGYDDNPWYRHHSHWGPPIVPTVAQLALGGPSSPPVDRMPRATWEEMRSGMNATSVILHTGPVFVGRTYAREAFLVEKGTRGRHCFRTIETTWCDGDRVVSRSRWKIKWITTRPPLTAP